MNRQDTRQNRSRPNRSRPAKPVKKRQPIVTRGCATFIILIGIVAMVATVYFMMDERGGTIPREFLSRVGVVVESEPESDFYYYYANVDLIPESRPRIPLSEITVHELDASLIWHGTDLAVFYMNLETGFTYVHNPDRVFFGASLAKVTHAFYVYTLAERGLIDMYHVHTFTATDHWGGTGVVQFMPAGTRFTTRELLKHAIVNSCNVASRMLIRFTENMDFSFRDFVQEIGADTAFIRDIIAQNTSARDMGIWMYTIHNYLESDSLYGHYFQYDLMNPALTSHPYFTRWEGSFGVGGEVNVSLIQSDYPMARKYGWATNAFHDGAIVYASSPYILVILSNMERGAHDLFEEISFVFQEFNNEFFG